MISRKFSIQLSLALFYSSLLFSAGCTRPSDGQSTVRLALPDFSKMGRPSAYTGKSLQAKDVGSLTVATYPSRIMLNVQGSGMQPVVFIRDSSGPNQPAPTSVPLMVPMGSGRLVQALFITRTVMVDGSGNKLDDDGTEVFYYGDVSLDILQSSVDVNLTVSQVFSGTAPQGLLAGRFIDSDGSGPTGRVSIRYSPPNGRPAMEVSSTEIHGGWFEFFALEGFPMKYILDGGRDLFPGFTLGSTPAGLTQTQAFVTVPQAYKSIYSSGTEVARSQTSGGKFYLGFFGDGTTGKKVCFESTTGKTLKDLYTSSTLGDSTLVEWAGGGVPPAPKAGVQAGGQSAVNGECDGAGSYTNYWTDWIKIDYSRLKERHGIFGNRGPFRAFQPTAAESFTTLDAKSDGASTVNLKWAYLPGAVGAGRVNGVGIFTRVLAQTSNNQGNRDYEQDGNIICNQLTEAGRLNQPFQFVTRVAVSAAPLAIQTASISGISPTDFGSGRVQVILCPYTEGRPGYWAGGVDYAPYSSGGSQSSYYLKLTNATTGGKPNTVYAGSCQRLKVEAGDWNGNALALPSGATLTAYVAFGSETANGSFYSTSDGSCSGTASNKGTAVFTAANNGAYVDYRPTTAGYVPMSLSFSGSNLPPLMTSSGIQTQFGVVAAAVPAINQLTVKNPFLYSGGTTLWVSNQCYPIEVQVHDSGALPTVATSTAVTGSFAAPAGTFYSDSKCQTSMSTFTIPLGQHASIFYYKPDPVGSTQTSLSIITTGATGDGGSISNAVSLPGITIDPQTVSSFIVENWRSGNTIPAGTGCKELRVTALSASGAHVRMPTDANITVNAVSGVNLYASSSGSCSSGALTSLNTFVPAFSSYSQNPIYVKETTSGTNIVLEARPTGGGAGPNSTIHIAPPAQLSVSSGTTPSALMQGFCHPLQFDAKSREGSTYTVPFSYNVDVSPSYAELYTDAECTTTTTVIGFAASSALSNTVYFKPNISSPAPSLYATGVNYMANAPHISVGGLPDTYLNWSTGFSLTATYVSDSASCFTFDLVFGTALSGGLSPANVLVDIESDIADQVYLGSTCASGGQSSQTVSYNKGTSTAVRISVLKTGPGMLRPRNPQLSGANKFRGSPPLMSGASY